jgi:hypothetical protein
MKPVLKTPGPTLLKLIYDGPLSNFAFNFNLRRYTKELVLFLEAPVASEAGAYTRPLLSST